ncbi:CAP1 [Cordylochernes scorpioides]|uniref:CAP1 n=1 Tax=Cordylochernes scorpioides TaxID=51811 RepID=A0ABY6K3A0_9ARAC|nr:CAP1 [Cordylochernes scorpioides]
MEDEILNKNFDDDSETENYSLNESSDVSTDEECDSILTTVQMSSSNCFIGKNGYKWNKNHAIIGRTRSHNIITHLPGLKGPAKPKPNCSIDIFNLFFTAAIIKQISEFTNAKIEEFRQRISDLTKSTYSNFTSEIEIRAFLADNWFTSIELVDKLKEHGLTYLGTMRKNKPQIPPQFQPHPKRESGTSIFGFSGTKTLVSYVPKKRKSVILISSMHHDNKCDKTTGKPDIIMDYNLTKGSVDTIDQMVSNFSTSCRSRRWPLALFYALLDITALNSYIIFNYQIDKKDQKERSTFIVDLGRSLIDEHLATRNLNSLPLELQTTIKKFKNNDGSSTSRGSTMPQESDTPKRCYKCPSKNAGKVKTLCSNTLMNLLKPTSDKIQAIQEYRQKNRASSLFNHLSAISESIPALGWVAVSPTPAPYVKEMLDAGQFYTNRVLVDYKDKDKLHVDWAKSWIQVLTQLRTYVMQDHTTGLVWGGGPAAAAGLPPPPPPPPPAGLFQDSGAGDDTRAALFKEISQGEGITRGLRKVTSDQQTHKNPTLRTSGPAPGSKPAGPPSTPPKPVVAKPPKLELEGKKWRVENHVDRRDIVIDGTEMNQVVNIYQCQNCVVQVKGKINSIVVDSCKKTAIVFDDIVSTVEFINCKSIQAQSMGTVPTVTVDKAESVLIYLSPRSLDCEVVTSMSFEVNVAIPKGDGDFAEHSIPEQFKSVWNGKVLKTVPIEKN